MLVVTETIFPFVWQVKELRAIDPTAIPAIRAKLNSIFFMFISAQFYPIGRIGFLGLVYHGAKIGRNIVSRSLSVSTKLSDGFCFLVVWSVNQRFTMENIHAENAELWEARSDEILASGRLPMIHIVLRETNKSLRTSAIPDNKRLLSTTNV